jgi:hypothetical protein
MPLEEREELFAGNRRDSGCIIVKSNHYPNSMFRQLYKRVTKKFRECTTLSPSELSSIGTSDRGFTRSTLPKMSEGSREL